MLYSPSGNITASVVIVDYLGCEVSNCPAIVSNKHRPYLPRHLQLWPPIDARRSRQSLWRHILQRRAGVPWRDSRTAAIGTTLRSLLRRPPRKRYCPYPHHDQRPDGHGHNGRLYQPPTSHDLRRPVTTNCGSQNATLVLVTHSDSVPQDPAFTTTAAAASGS